jgi:hypothetical protein
MSEYLKLAELLEDDPETGDVSLEKIASLCLLHEYIDNDDFNIFTPELMKIANEIIAEDNLALELGVELGVKALTSRES